MLKPALRKVIRTRSQGICEKCGQRKAEHMHHLTYARAGHELPEDIQHVCLICHGEYHPHHIFRPVWEQRMIAAQRGKTVSKRKPRNPWKKLEQEAWRSLNKAAKFNRLSVSARRGK